MVYLLISPTNTVLSSPLLGICWKEACNNTDPHAMGCDVHATTVAAGTFGDAYLQLRRSYDCGSYTYWARTSNVGGVQRYLNATLKYYYWSASPGVTWGPIYTNQRYSASGGMNACGWASATGPLNCLWYSPCVP